MTHVPRMVIDSSLFSLRLQPFQTLRSKTSLSRPIAATTNFFNQYNAGAVVTSFSLLAIEYKSKVFLLYHLSLLHVFPTICALLVQPRKIFPDCWLAAWCRSSQKLCFKCLPSIVNKEYQDFLAENNRDYGQTENAISLTLLLVNLAYFILRSWIGPTQHYLLCLTCRIPLLV